MNDFQDTLIDQSHKRHRISTKDLVLTGMFTAIICVLSQLSIPIQPIPFTLSLFAIFLTGAILPPRYALMSVLAYLLLGVFGLPVFAGLKGGLHVLTGMTGGYLMAYPLMALCTSLFYKISGKKVKLFSLILGMVLALILCYTIGSLWFAYITDTSFSYALSVCVVPFVLFDLVKIGLAAFTGLLIKRLIRYEN